MASYLSPSGLTALAGFESSGNPLAQNPTSSASGLYGFTNPTWQAYAPAAGVDIAQYPTANSAPSDIQTAVASVTPVSNWTCPGCDPGFTAALQSNPSYLTSGTVSENGMSFSSPPDSGGSMDTSGSAATLDYGGFPTDAFGSSSSPYTNTASGTAVPTCGQAGADPVACMYDPSQSPSEPGLGTTPLGGGGTDTSGIGAAATGAVSSFLNFGSDFWQRSGLVVVGAILLLAGLFIFGFEKIGSRYA